MSRKNIIKEFFFDKDNLKFYYGIPSCCSSYSSGTYNPFELYEYASNCDLNFLFLTDFNDSLTSKTSSNDDISKWRDLKNIYNKAKRSHNNFIPIVGFQCKIAPFGNFNIINSKNIFSGTVRDLRFLTLWMINNQNSFISISNGSKTSSLLPFFDLYNKIITSFEISIENSLSSTSNNDKYYFSLLDRGWKLGAISYQNNTDVTFANYENFTAYIGYELSKDYLIDAFKSRRTYFTQSKSLKLYFSINETFMGNTLFLDNSKVKFSIYAEDFVYKIEKIEVISNNYTIIKSISDINLNNIKYLYEHIHSKDESWYVIKLYQNNNKIAVSSPIFISLENEKEV